MNKDKCYRNPYSNNYIFFSPALEEDGFGSLQFFQCFVAVDNNGTLVGYALYFPVYKLLGEVVYIEDLYVTPAMRSKGIGTRLCSAVFKVRKLSKIYIAEQFEKHIDYMIKYPLVHKIVNSPILHIIIVFSLSLVYIFRCQYCKSH